jgi:hypothetical protein
MSKVYLVVYQPRDVDDFFYHVRRVYLDKVCAEIELDALNRGEEYDGENSPYQIIEKELLK